MSAVLFVLGMLVLLSPVWTHIPRDGQLGNSAGEFTRVCGPTITQAFSVPGPLAQGGDRDSALDCVAAARGRAGYGVLLLLLAVPPIAVALLTPRPRAVS
jgi:hypothetical protein